MSLSAVNANQTIARAGITSANTFGGPQPPHQLTLDDVLVSWTP